MKPQIPTLILGFCTSVLALPVGDPQNENLARSVPSPKQQGIPHPSKSTPLHKRQTDGKTNVQFIPGSGGEDGPFSGAGLPDMGEFPEIGGEFPGFGDFPGFGESPNHKYSESDDAKENESREGMEFEMPDLGDVIHMPGDSQDSDGSHFPVPFPGLPGDSQDSNGFPFPFPFPGLPGENETEPMTHGAKGSGRFVTGRH
ncbi:hypothetical protein EYZ11_001641 [Aspergillus tanneri]|uniref:Uncharacterized protein n=1 Tax=Aspergillus tanneri TaxID=1220188 RepID=A0A4S3JSN6_9EURO|nr:uncharacterized protein ATNIH1004_008558 [Aspergillus tanneri]KAA8644357.1 hypothetical protein ATNIH1004_008558 [Aspergillus tanneri]THC98863.1 hypothetical protein EYZ11_001641 [Aspergillus tanneri]